MPFAGYQATSIIEKAKHVHQLLFTSMLYFTEPQNIFASSQVWFPSLQPLRNGYTSPSSVGNVDEVSLSKQNALKMLLKENANVGPELLIFYYCLKTP